MFFVFCVFPVPTCKAICVQHVTNVVCLKIRRMMQRQNYLRRLLCCLDAVSFTSNKVINAAALHDTGDTLVTLCSNEISHSTILHLTPCCLNKTDL